MQNKITLIATTAFGLEAIVKREVESLGFKILKTFDGKIEFEAELQDIPKANLWLRCADRVLLKFGEFPADTFDELFENTKELPWENIITQDGKFTVIGKSVKSTLGSVSACQSIVKKAVVDRLKEKYHIDWFKETGPEYTIQVAILKDTATLTIDTSGTGLHKRGYRAEGGKAPLKETLAAALAKLSIWNKDKILIDPMCGSGTILIEAALIAKNIAPGLKRTFASELWPIIGNTAWQKTRKEAENAIIHKLDLQIQGYDIDEDNIHVSINNAKRAGLENTISFTQKDIKDLWIDQESGVIIANPPYGERLLDYKEINEIYISLHKTFRKKKNWAVYVLTSDEVFPNYFKRAYPTRVRKLYNGKIQVNYYQYY
jgi:putative N6-adenine-specific DNA methylase